MVRKRTIAIHAILMVFVVWTLIPFLFVINNSFRTTSELERSFFGLPKSLGRMATFTLYELTGKSDKIVIRTEVEGDNDWGSGGQTEMKTLEYGDSMRLLWQDLTSGYRLSWKDLRPYTLNTFFVCFITVCGVICLGSISAYIFSRYKFPGRSFLFVCVLSVMMIPQVLTLVPSFLLVKKMNLLNSYWVLILPYVAGGQIFAIFLFKSFFDGLPQDLFDAAKIDGAGHFRLYWNVVLPLSKPIISVVAILNVLGTWNNFLWPFVTNTDPKYHVVASGVYVIGKVLEGTDTVTNLPAMYAAYVLSSIPLLILFVYATKPFIQGVSAGAFKA